MADIKLKTFCCLLPILCLLLVSDVSSSTDVPDADAPSSTDVPADEAPSSTDVPADETPSSPDVPADEAPSSPDVPATNVSSSTEVPATNVSSSTEVPATNVSSSTEVPATNVSSSTEVPATNVSSSTEVPATNVSSSTEVPATNVSSSTEVPATNVSSSTEVPATNVSSSTEVPATNVSSSTEVPATNVSSSTEVPATNVSSSANISVADAPSSTDVPATNVSSSTDVSVTDVPVSWTSHDATELSERSSVIPESTSSIDVTPSTLETLPQHSETPSSSLLQSSPDTLTETAVTSSVEAVSTTAGVAVTTSTTGTASVDATAESVTTELSPTTLHQNLQTLFASDSQSSTDTSQAAAVTSSTHEASTSAGVSVSTTSASVTVSGYVTTSTHETTSSSSDAPNSTSLTQLYTNTSLATASGVAVTSSATDATSWNVIVSSAEATSASPSPTPVQISSSSSTSAAQSSTDTLLPTSATSSTQDVTTSVSIAATTTPPTDAASTNGTDSTPQTPPTSLSTTLAQSSVASSPSVSQPTTNTTTTTVTSPQSTTNTSTTTTVTFPQSTTDPSTTTTVTSPQSTTNTSTTTTVTFPQSTTDPSTTTTVTSPQSTTNTSTTTIVTSPQSTTDPSTTTTVTSPQSTTNTSTTTIVTSPQSTTDTSTTTTVTSSHSTTDTSTTTTVTSPQSTTNTSVLTTLTSSSTSTAGAETTTSTTVVVSSNGTVSTPETKSTTSMSSSLNDSSTQSPVQTSSSEKATVSSVNPITAISSTISADVIINSSVVEDCYWGFPISQLKELYQPMFYATCSGRKLMKWGALLGNVTFPQVAIPDVKAILARNVTWASPTRLPAFNSSVNCSDVFDNLTDAAILSVVSVHLVTGMNGFKLSLDDGLATAATCIPSHISKAAADVYTNELDEISRAYKNITSLLKVYADGVLAALQQVTGCSGVADCNGVCGGKAKLDWDCRVCYGGDTSYKITFAGDLKDCNNTCLGKAFVEPCTGTCVGGNTGRRAEDYVDCAGICLGPNIRDSCNICVANTSQSRHGSQFMDCTGKCFVKANMSSMAVNNSCGVCVLGDTGRPANSGVDVCGVCNGTNSTCQDCNQVPNGGKVLDACGECGGQGTKCLAVTSVSPGVVPSGVPKVVVVTGAGFNASLDTCVAEGRDTGGNQTVYSRSGNPPDSVSRLTLTLPSTLAADSYTIKCRLSGGSYANSTAVVTVYNSSVTTVTGVSKTSFTISPPSQEVIEFQGSGFMSNSTFCKFTDTSGGVKHVVATVYNGSSATCSVSHPEVSERYTVQLTFNQVDLVGAGFTLTALAAAPTVVANFSDNGDKVQVFMSPAVDLQQGSTCSDIFSSVVSLGASAVCTVVSRQLVHITDSTVQPGGVLVLRDDTIRAFSQRFSRTATGNVTVTSPSNPVTPHAVLTGPDVVSSCTRSFTVDGRRSTGLGGRPGNYSWHVHPSSNLILSGSTSSVLTVSNQSAGHEYNITLTLCNFLGQCHTAGHTVQQTANNAPDVVIETFADVTKVKPSDRLTLAAKATLYPNCADDQIVFAWTFNPTFQLNPDYTTRAVYTIDPYLLPVPATIVASVRASLATNGSAFNTANVSITTVLSNLDAKIQGADVRTIGVDSGYFTLDATQSLDPDGLAGDMTYIWTCVELTDYPTSCLDKSSQVMPNSSQKTQGLMTLGSTDLEAGKTYLFTVTVSKKSQGASRFASTNVTVNALAGDPPRVQLNLFNGNRGRYSVDEMVTMAAELTASSPVTVEWSSYESSDYGYVNLSDSAVVGAKQQPLLVDSATNAYVAFLTIRAGVLSRGTTYRVQCKVTAANQSATSAVSFYIRRGVTSCKFSVEGGSYTELGAVRGKVEQCDTDQDGQPMTFDFFVVTDADAASVKRLTKPSSLGQLDISYGPKAYLTGGNNFTVQVCAALGGCTWFNTSFVNVVAISSDSLTTIKTTIIKAAKDLHKSGNPLDGILSLATYLQSQLSSRSRRSTDVQTPEVNGLVLDLANDTLRTTYPSETVLKTLMDGLASVPPTSLSDQDLLRMLSIYEEIASGYGAADVSTMSPEQVGQIKRFENYLVNTRGLPTSQNLSLILTAAWRKSLAFGTKAEINTDKGTLSYSVQTLSSTELSRSSSSLVSLNFGDSLNKRYNRWSCSSSQCLGVGVEVFHYSTNSFPNPPPDSTISADVITLTLFDQTSGADISNISNLESPVTLTFSLVQPKGAPYLCKYWEAASGTWRTEGVTTNLQTADTVVCSATHLTDFTVVSDSSSGSNNAALIGGVVGGVLGALFLVVIVVIVVFYFKKQNRVGSTPSLRRVLVNSKREESASTQNLQVREQPDIGQQSEA